MNRNKAAKCSYNLARFVEAQRPVYDDVRGELRAGCKRTHWMWFVFPQIAGLGHSPIARHFSIATIDEAKAFLAHPQLGPRLAECTRLTLGVSGKSAERIFGTPDWMKFRSSMTLFAEAASGASVFAEALEKYFNGEPDAATLAILARLRNGS
ncbi:MAG: DUF1810 domain-containing protein [Alphaproteobacteria bacterium]|nr:DUF1810 domain-containing protein [Alphaproteobacteria bacterium]